jgi:hypothetical protein
LQVNGSLTNDFSDVVDEHGTLAGRGTIQGDVNNHGKVSPGSAGAPGMLTVDGNYEQFSQFATLMIQLAGAGDGQFSVLSVFETAFLNGTLEPVLLNGFTPTVGQTFAFLFYGSREGEFSRIANVNFDDMHWSITYEDTMAILTVEAGHAAPDQGSTLLLLTLVLLGLVTYQRLLRRKPERSGMKALPKKLLPLTLFAIAVTSLFCVRPTQAYTVTLEQVGAKVVANGSGAINVTGLHRLGSVELTSGFVRANFGVLFTGPTSNADVYFGLTGPVSFGSGSTFHANTSIGDFVGIVGLDSERCLHLPQGYASGAALSSTATWNGATLPASASRPAPTYGHGGLD